jgi:Gram-negative porin
MGFEALYRNGKESILVSYRGKTAIQLGGAFVAAALLLVPAIATAKPDQKKRPPAVSISFDRVTSFTPASADPKLAAAFANRQSAADFKFTPAAPKGRTSQVRVAIRARASDMGGRTADLTGATPAIGAVTPASYNLGVAVGWRRFAVTGEVGKTRSANLALGGHETAVVGVNYSLKRFTGRVAASAERSDGTQAPLIGREKAYAVDVGGAYSLTRNIAVTGGVRYKIDRDRAALQDERRDSQAVYVGTAFKF